jgi:transposase-like protein
VEQELSLFPDNTWLTKEVSDSARWSRIFVVDGKFVKVKGFKQKIPLIWGLDYLSHDIPAAILSPTESEAAFSQLFAKLKTIGYTPRVAVCDDRAPLKTALLKVFPYAKLQLCHTHYLENIRQLLHIRTNDTHSHFFNSLKLHVFTEPKTKTDVYAALKQVQDKHAQTDDLRKAILLEIHRRIDDLFTYLDIPDCPNNTNLIELYNSHLNGRLKTIKGFSSAQSAGAWLNAYIIRRRTKELTDCEQKFKYLNGHASIELSIKKQALWPDVLTNLGINKPKFFEKNP